MLASAAAFFISRRENGIDLAKGASDQQDRHDHGGDAGGERDDGGEQAEANSCGLHDATASVYGAVTIRPPSFI
jgi:hypothetical protein